MNKSGLSIPEAIDEFIKQFESSPVGFENSNVIYFVSNVKDGKADLYTSRFFDAPAHTGVDIGLIYFK